MESSFIELIPYQQITLGSGSRAAPNEWVLPADLAVKTNGYNILTINFYLESLLPVVGSGTSLFNLVLEQSEDRQSFTLPPLLIQTVKDSDFTAPTSTEPNSVYSGTFTVEKFGQYIRPKIGVVSPFEISFNVRAVMTLKVR